MSVLVGIKMQWGKKVYESPFLVVLFVTSSKIVTLPATVCVLKRIHCSRL